MIFFIVFLIITVLFTILFITDSISLIAFTLKFEKIRKKFHLNINRGSIFRNPSLDGAVKGKKIAISKEKINKGNYLNILISHDIDIKGDFCISKESVLSKLKSAAGIKDIKIYDDIFDGRMLLDADSALILNALLNKKTRDEIIKLSDCTAHLEITNKMINFKMPLTFFSKESGINYLIKTAITISNYMAEKRPVKKRIIDNIKDVQNSPQFRIGNIHLLTENFPDDRDVNEFLKLLLEDSDQEIRIASAICLKEEGLAYLLKVIKRQKKIKSTVNPRIIKILGENKYAEAVPDIIEIYESKNIPELKYICLKALNGIADQSANDFLVKELINSENRLRDEAIKALASCGTREAVEPLFNLNKTIINPIIKNLIQETISKIQSRLGPHDMGALSIAEHSDKDGALSISNEEEVKGGLTIAENKNKEKKLSEKGGT